MSAQPQLPRQGTDAWRMLCELARTYPDTAWQLNSRLGITAHSRAPDLRRLGWTVDAVTRPNPDPTRSRKPHRGYVLRTPPTPELVEAIGGGPPVDVDERTGQVRLAC